VITSDGYRLGLQRIEYGRQGKPAGGLENRPVVFLQHGLLCDSTNWITNLPSESLGFILADAGFDVWMGNFRGNSYSKTHISLNPKKHEFWKFSWDEMADKDLPAMINYTLQHTNQKQLYYVGHSQGTMTMFAKSTYDYEFAKMIRVHFALAPVSGVGHIKGPLRLIAKWTDHLEGIFNLLGWDEFLPSTWLTQMLGRFVCGSIFTNPLCANVLFLIAGPDSDQLNRTRIPVYVGHNPAGTSVQNVVHFGQMVQSNLFNKYDYGTKEENERHYGTPTPPIYDLSKMITPTVLFWGANDWLADPTDVGMLRSKLPPSSIIGDHYFEDYNHLDFIWGMKAAPDIYTKIVEGIKKDFYKS